MNFEVSIFSLMFFIACVVYFYWGIYLIRLNPKEKINRVFLGLTIALIIWSLGYGMSNSAVDIETALFWRRIAAAGKIFSFSMILHFILVLTQDKDRIYKDLNSKIKLIYLPAFVLLFVFSICSNMVIIHYNLVKVDYGWTNIATINIWNIVYYIYYTSYMVTVLVLVYRWKKSLRDKVIAKQATNILITMGIVFFIGSFIDIILSFALDKQILQVTPLLILIPTGAVYRAARYYEVFELKITEREEYIVTRVEEKRIFSHLAILFLLGGTLVTISRYYADISDIRDSLELGLPIVVMGIVLAAIQKLENSSIRDNATTILLIISIPIISFLFLDHLALTLWVFPIVIIVSSLLFSNRTLLYAATIVAVATQLLIWAIMPSSSVAVNNHDYLTRIAIIIIVFLIGLYINQVYISKVKENKSQLGFQRVVSDITLDLVSLNNDNLDSKIDKILLEIGAFLNADRAYFFTINNKKNTMTYSNEWSSSQVSLILEIKKEESLDRFPWWINKLKDDKLIYIDGLDSIPKEARAEKERLLKQNVKSLLSVPVMVEGEMQAFIVIDSVLSNRYWNDENIEHLSIISNIIAGGLLRIKADKEVENMAYYDNLTGLPNRFLFADIVNQAIVESKGTRLFICIMFIDLDDFKSVNDTIGHKGGDKLLRRVAKNLIGVIRQNDTIARFGGDEFLIMLKDIQDISQANQMADKIMGVFSKPFVVNGKEFVITASAGLSICPVDGHDSEALIKNADLAMYKAKGKGKNQYAICSDEMKEEVEHNIALSNDLYRALERNELVVHYQAQMDIATNKISGVEALLRWNHPTKGMIPPMVFIPIAEKNGLINTIGEWVLREACSQNKKWQDMGLPHIDVAVNLSAIQMINPELSHNVESVIKETGLDAKYVELEITESVAIKETNYVIDILNKLKGTGVSIAIDDFGTGYSSLSILKMLPVDRIKIDIHFIRGLEKNEEDRIITEVIINLAKSLGLNVIAEGVETQLQLDFLNEKMCDNVQGYYFYKPMPSHEMEKILTEMAKE